MSASEPQGSAQTTSPVAIREAIADDCPRLAALSTELGYPMTPGEAMESFGRISDHPDHGLLVAVCQGVPAGWIQVSLTRIFESPVQAEIAGLVVNAALRGRGIGKQLVDAAESWARRRGCAIIRVRSNVVRERAHGFYRRAGYRDIKTQMVFEKGL